MTKAYPIQFLILSFFYLSLVGCSSSSSKAKLEPVSENQAGVEKPLAFVNLDTEFATYILEEKYSKILRISVNLLTIDTPQERKDAVTYWRDMAMLFMGVEVEETGRKSDVLGIDKKRWNNISDELRFDLMKKLVVELNNYVRKDAKTEGKQTEIIKLRQDIIVLTQKQQKLEQLLQDLEKIK